MGCMEMVGDSMVREDVAVREITLICRVLILFCSSSCFVSDLALSYFSWTMVARRAAVSSVEGWVAAAGEELSAAEACGGGDPKVVNLY